MTKSTKNCFCYHRGKQTNSTAFAINKMSLLLLLFTLFTQIINAQSPCNAHRWNAGDGWRFNTTTSKWEAQTLSSPNLQPKGIVRCASSAETEVQLQNFAAKYNPNAFTINTTLTNCFNQETSTRPTNPPLTVTGPTTAKDIVWFNFDIRPLAGTYQFQIITNDQVGWALYYVNPDFAGPPATNTGTGTYPSTATGLSGFTGNCQTDVSRLIYADCGISGNGWSTIKVPSFLKPSNYYLAMWPLTQNTFTNNLVYKSRYGCGGSTCFLEADGNPVLNCTNGGYTVCQTYNGSAGKWMVVDNAAVKATSYTVTTYDQFGAVVSTANRTSYADLIANPLYVELGTITGASPQNDIRATVCATYASGNAYDISLTVSGKPAGAPNDYVDCTSSGRFSGNGLATLGTPAATPSTPACGATTANVQVNNFDASAGITYTLEQGNVVKYTADNTGLFTNVTSGNYSLVATKVGSCKNNGSVTVPNAPTQLDEPSATPTAATCTNSKGSAQVDGFEASDGITYTLEQGGVIKYTADNTGLFSNVTPDTYTIVATKTGNCRNSSSVTIAGAPNQLSAPTATPTQPDCNNAKGSATIDGYVANANITYTLEQGGVIRYTAAAGVFSNIDPGTYTLVASKAGNCPNTGSLTINNAPTQLAAPAGTPTAASCTVATGSVQVNNPDANITYTLQQGNVIIYTANSSGLFSSVQPGNYTLVATKAGNCPNSSSISVDGPPSQLGAPSAAPTSATCTNAKGSAQVNSFDASITYTLEQAGVTKYTASNTGLFANVDPGNYVLVANKAGFCKNTGSVTIGTAPDLLAAPSATPTQPDCNNAKGSATVNGYNGADGITYTLEKAGVIKYTAVSGVFSNLDPDTYDLVATKEGFCTNKGSLTINNAPSLLNAPAGTPTGATCTVSTGSVQVNNFDASITYTLQQANAVVYTANNSGFFSTVTPGNYALVATKAGYCTNSSNISVGGPPSGLDAPTATPTQPDCNNANGSATVNSFDASITYTLEQAGIVKYTANNTGLFSNVAPGTYALVAKKAGSCTNAGSVTINNAPNQLSVPAGTPTGASCASPNAGSVQVNSFDATITYTLEQGGVVKYTANNTGLFSSVTPGSYQLVAKKVGSCTNSSNISVAVAPPCGGAIYTFTQGFYGNKNGKACVPSADNPTAVVLISRAIQNMGGTLYIGQGSNKNADGGSFTAYTNQASLLNAILPGGSNKNSVLSSDYNLNHPNNYPPLKNGKIENVFLSQTITLALNLAIPQNGQLGTLRLSGNWLVTQMRNPASSCSAPSSLACGTTNSIQSFYIPSNVLTALGNNNTVLDLLNFAKAVLGGQNTNVPNSDIVQAVDAINNAFDGGRFFLRWSNTKMTCVNYVPYNAITLRSTMAAPESKDDGLSVLTSPNPYRDRIRLNIQSKTSGQGSLEVYNLVGQKVTTLYQGCIEAGQTRSFNYAVPMAERTDLIYILRVGDKLSTGKILKQK